MSSTSSYWQRVHEWERTRSAARYIGGTRRVIGGAVLFVAGAAVLMLGLHRDSPALSAGGFVLVLAVALTSVVRTQRTMGAAGRPTANGGTPETVAAPAAAAGPTEGEPAPCVSRFVAALQPITSDSWRQVAEKYERGGDRAEAECMRAAARASARAAAEEASGFPGVAAALRSAASAADEACDRGWVPFEPPFSCFRAVHHAVSAIALARWLDDGEWERLYGPFATLVPLRREDCT